MSTHTHTHTQRRRLDPAAIDAHVVAAAAEVIRRGGLVAFPTETVYGLGADGANETAVRAIFEAKGRPSDNPLILHAAGLAMAKRCTAAWPDAAGCLAAAFWPGPLTLVLPKAATVPDAVTAGGPTVAVRMPSHPVAWALIAAVGRPLAAPSANRSNRISPTTADHVLATLNGRIPLVLDAGPTTAGIESTVVDLTGPPRILRPGTVTAAQLAAVLGQPVTAAADDPARRRSPGTSERHYAPRTRLALDADGESLRQAVAGGAHVARLRWGVPADVTDKAVRLPADAAAAARGLYAALHELDAAGADVILVDPLPAGDEWVAVADRLRRAAAQETEVP